MTTRNPCVSFLVRSGVRMLLATPFILASSAYPDTISVGFQEAGTKGGAITTEGTTLSGNMDISNLLYGTFTVNDVSAFSRQILGTPGLLTSQSLDISSSTAGTLTIYITAQDLSFTGVQKFASSFAVNDLEGSITKVTESTYFSPTNRRYNVGQTLLDSASFNDIGAQPTEFALGLTSGTYSVTEKYVVIDAGGSAGNDNVTIDLAGSPVPEPSSLLLVGSALALAGLLYYHRRNKSPHLLISNAWRT